MGVAAMKSFQLLELLVCSTVAAYCLGRVMALLPDVYDAVAQIAVNMWQRKARIDPTQQT